MHQSATNHGLLPIYQSIYKQGADRFHTFTSFAESRLIFDFITDWQNLTVLEIGCGEGRLACMIGLAGAADVTAIDYSSEAIATAKHRHRLDNISFSCQSAESCKGQHDVVILQGVLEHLDQPFAELDRILNINMADGGCALVSTPSFLNPRGYIWMTLQLLFDVPMSLTDLHFLCPFDFQEFATEHGYNIETRSTNQDWGAGHRTILDLRKRLKNALSDAGMSVKHIHRFLEWIEKAVPYFNTDDFSGQTVAYKITKR